ncbi:hypothetical protein [Mameliella alba]|uniref:hypothetical protein n=1 Tax=Mameliella alba TaxID=561184 RepID=UPI0014311DBF|nr:hypothetical protein [Mameliella alba]
MTGPKNTSVSRNARPMLFGFALGFAAALGTVGIAQVRATVNTNGVLFGYTVQKDGATISAPTPACGSSSEARRATSFASSALPIFDCD